MSGEDPIVEFAFEGNGPLDTKKTPIKKMPSIENNSNGNQKILYTGPGEIFVPLETNTFYSVYDHEDISKLLMISLIVLKLITFAVTKLLCMLSFTDSYDTGRTSSRYHCLF